MNFAQVLQLIEDQNDDSNTGGISSDEEEYLDMRLAASDSDLRWLPTVLIVQHTIVFKKPLFYHLAKYDYETRPHNCYNIANYEK